MSGPDNDSLLNADLVLRRAFDEATGKLKVDAEVTATIGDVDVVIDAAGGDNIAISDGTDVLAINPDGSINVVADIDTTGLATSAKQDLLLAELQLKADLTETQPVSVASLPLPTNAASLSEQQAQTSHLAAIEIATEAIQGNNYNQLLAIDNSIKFKPATRLDEATATVTYVGEAAAGSLTSSAVWLIKKIDETSGIIITFADGDSSYNNIWDNRAALTYS